MKEPLAERLEAFANDAGKLSGFARDHVLKTLGGCTRRNIGEIAAALRERQARFENMDGPPLEQEVKHLADQCGTLLAENEFMRQALENARRDLNEICPRSDTGSKRKKLTEAAIARIEAALGAVNEKPRDDGTWIEPGHEPGA